MNRKKSINNVLFGILNLSVSIGLGILIPRLTIVNLGSESNGLLSSVNQLLKYVALLEAGVGTASLQALYATVGEKNEKQTAEIMEATSRYYRKTGVAYFFAILGIAVIYPSVVESTLSKYTIFVVVLLSGLPGVINYFFHGKYRILLRAEGKNYIQTNVSTVMSILTSLGKIVLLLNGYDLIAILSLNLFINLIQMLYYQSYIKKHYKWLNMNVEPNYKAIEQRNFVLVHQICYLIFDNTDVILLTFFCGLKAVSLYSMYVLLFDYVNTLVGVFNGSIVYVLGQTFNYDKEKFAKLYDAFEVCNMSLTFSLFCIANIFVIPFMKLYTNGVTDINYIDPALSILITFTYLLSNGRVSSRYVINFANHFKQTQNRVIIEALLNITISLVCIMKFGIHGVLMGTIVALFYRANDMILYASRKILNRKPNKTYIRWFTNMLLFCVFLTVCKSLPIKLESYSSIIVWAIIFSIIIIPSFFGVALFFDKEVFKTIKKIISKSK